MAEKVNKTAPSPTPKTVETPETKVETPVETPETKVETKVETPVETPETKVETKVETPEAKVETPVETSETKVETPVETPETKVETPVETPEKTTEQLALENIEVVDPEFVSEKVELSPKERVLEIIKIENNFNYLSSGRFLKEEEISDKNLKSFYQDYKASGSMTTPIHYELLKLLDVIFE